MARSGSPEQAIVRMEHVLGALGLLDKIRISFDEWNLRGWHHPSFLAADPKVVERDKNDDNTTYTMADALFAARFLNGCLRHCRTVGMATFSPVVNTRGAIFTHADGIVLRTTYHVFDLYANHTGPQVLDAHVQTPHFPVLEEPTMRAQDSHAQKVQVPYVDAVATLDPKSATLSVALTNLHPAESMTCVIELGTEATGRATLRRLDADSPDAYNDIAHPDRVHIETEEIAIGGRVLTLNLPPHSLSVLSLPGTSLGEN